MAEILNKKKQFEFPCENEVGVVNVKKQLKTASKGKVINVTIEVPCEHLVLIEGCRF